MFCFPYDPGMLQKWFIALHRDDLKSVSDIGKSMRVCAKHFLPEDFEDTSKYRKLKRHALPRLFPDTPHFDKLPDVQRSYTSSAERRLKAENKLIALKNEEILSIGVFSNYEEMITAISSPDFLLPTGYQIIKSADCVTFLFISGLSENPELVASVLFKNDLHCSIFLKRRPLPIKQINHLLRVENQVRSSIEISNILAYVKSLSEIYNQEEFINEDEPNFIETAVNILEKSLEKNNYGGKEELLFFLIQQLRLIGQNPHQYRYSSDIIIHSFQWKLISTALYKKLSTFFILPSIRRLQQLSTGLNVRPTQLDFSYLSSRIRNLKEQERVCILLFDEVYTAAKVEYQNGEFVGLTEEGTVAKTLVVFMVRSLIGKFKDVIKLIPTSKLTAETLYDCTENILRELGDMNLIVIALGADNHPVNR